MKPVATAASEFFRPLVRFDTVIAVQSRLRCKALDFWFIYFPLLGNEIQYILVSPFLAWCCGVEGQKAMRYMSLISYVTCWISDSIKELLKLPRPPAKLHVSSTDVERVSLQYGFPSTHSAHAVTHAFFLASFAAESGVLSSTAATAIAVGHVFHICLSRLYLGVHSLADISAGLTIGAVMVFLFIHVLVPLDEMSVELVGREPLLGMVTLFVAWTAIPCMVLYPDKRSENTAWLETVLFGAVYAGSAIACALSPQASTCPPSQSVAVAAGSFVLGLVFLGVTRVGISAVSKALLGGSKRMTRKDVHGKMVDTTLNVYRHLFITTVIAFAITGVVKPCLWLDMLYPPPPPAPPSRAWWMIK